MSPDPEGPPTVVGIGASAGGLAALRGLLACVPEESGVAWVVVVHLSPEHESHLAQLLQPHARLPVQQVSETVPLEPDRVYVIPPGANLSAIDTHLRLSEIEAERSRRAPIDHFFRTLAATYEGHAVGVILSGTGSDGTLGIKDIKARDGLTVVQDPGEAEYDGMPQSAIATGLVDLILPLEAIPDAVLRYARTEPRVPLPQDGEEPREEAQRLLQRVFARIRASSGRDFSHYKRSTVLRRIRRRMQMGQVEELSAYVDRLRQDPWEVQALADDLLITVTSFFRDPELWSYLAKEVVPGIFEGKGPRDVVRVWSVGCATGEEAYSLAMLLKEEAARREPAPRIQVFASDLHEPSLERARHGFYPGEIEADVSAERLRRFFHQERGGYRVRKELREPVVFAPHNLLGDPPFSRLDLICCRNLLIYLQRDVQREVADVFHYALRADGVLVLGSSEMLDAEQLFRAEEKGLSVLRSNTRPASERRVPAFPSAAPGIPAGRRRRARSGRTEGYGALHERVVERYGPPSILVGRDHRVVHLSEHAGRYLLHPGGEATDSLFELVRDELRIELRATFHAARERNEAQRSQPVRLAFDGQPTSVVLDVRPALDPENEGFFLVMFDESAARALDGEPSGPPSEEGGRTRVRELQEKVQRGRERLQAIVEEYESSQEELRASNEELQSANEELRSMMEELETRKEELQSMNEELQAVNQENRHKVEELSQLSGDLQNLLAATDIATLFLDRELRILRFTPKVGELFNVRGTDRGRALSDLSHRLGSDDILRDAGAVLEDLAAVEREVTDDTGRCYLTRVLPYRTPDDRIEGVVITFVDITERKKTDEALRLSEARLQRMVNIEGVGVLTLSETGRILEANDAFLDMLGYGREELQAGRLTWRDLTPPEYVQESERQMAQLSDTGRIGPYEKPYVRRDGSRAWMMLAGADLGDGTLVKYCVDVSDRKRAEAALRRSEERYRTLFESIDEGFCVVEVLFDEAGRAVDYRLLEANPAFANLTGLEDAVGRRMRELEPGHEEHWFRAYGRVARTGEPERFQERAEHLGDRWYDVYAFPGGLDGEDRVAILLRDVTEARRAEEELREAKRAAEQASEAKSRFLSTMSHEFRTPLNAVIGLADLMEAEVTGSVNETQKDHLRRIRTSAWHLVSIIEEILTFSRADAGMEQVRYEEVDVAGIAGEVVDMLRHDADQRGLDLVLAGPDRPTELRTDGGKLRQILTNLVGNALKYTRSGRVEVEVAEGEAGVELHVRDTGPGIPPERWESIFEPFVQIEDKPGGRGGGTGLGLTICRRLTRLIGGELALDSTPGEGTTFTLRLPGAPEGDGSPSRSDADRAG